MFLLALLVCLVGTRTVADSQQGGEEAARKPPLYLEVQANVRGTLRAPFVPDMTLAQRAQILLRARTSSTAHVYMLHCDAHAALSIFPDAGGIDFRADQWVSLPAAGMPIRAGDVPGHETVYVIATRAPLAHSDAPLERWLSDTLQQPEAARCDGRLASLLAGAAAPGLDTPQPTAAHPPARKLPFALRGVDITNPKSSIARAFAERDGVVILRFTYTIGAP